MSKKQFDHIENRIREAAENNEPLYDAAAWTAMEARLDKEHARRYRFIAWMLPTLLLLVAGSIFFIRDKGGYQQQVVKPVPGVALITVHQPGNPAVGEIVPNSAPATSNMLADALPTRVKNRLRVHGQPTVNTKYHNSGKLAGIPYLSQSLIQHPPITVSITDMPGDIRFTGNHPLDEMRVHPKVLQLLVSDPQRILLVTARNNRRVVSSINPHPFVGQQRVQGARYKSTRFYWLASFGAEVTGVSMLSFKNNPLNIKYGVGMGYQLTKRLSLQTGLYQGKKKYIAGPADYTAKPGSYFGTVDIKKIDASCVVVDIPITLRYNFLTGPGVQYFATAGISSLIMKEEVYDYYYLRYNIPYQSTRKYNGNNHLLSVVNLSAGIEKKLSGTLSLLAEPAISIPIKGVGEGAVKLHGAALQLGLKYQPEKRKR